MLTWSIVIAKHHQFNQNVSYILKCYFQIYLYIFYTVIVDIVIILPHHMQHVRIITNVKILTKNIELIYCVIPNNIVEQFFSFEFVLRSR